jgi:putative endonuclease
MWYVYIMSNRAHTTYVGSTSDLLARYAQHKEKRIKSAFTARYTFNRLVYYEVDSSKREAEKRERQIKAWTREKKVALIQSMNPRWLDLHWKIIRAAIDVQT